MKNHFLLGIVMLFFFNHEVRAQLLHDYELNGDYLDAFGGNPMIPNGGSLTATEYVFGPDQGPNVSGVIDPGTYCIQLKFTPMATTGWRKILDFKNRTSDNGLYIFNSKLQFYPYPPGPDIAFSPGVPVTVLFTRDATTGEMNGYVNGVWQWTITDTGNDATFTGPGNIIYILIDDLQVPGESMSGSLDFFRISGLNVGTLDLDLGDPVYTCDPYEIDPGVTGVDFHWSDGSTNPTLLVTESGTYALTITEGCSGIGIDSVEVIFEGVPDGVDIGPPEVTICEGDSYVISLDPTIGSYEWQDGSTDPVYTISTPGVYQVSFDDGCDITTDVINVIVMDGPAPFSLGSDVSLCPGEEIEFSFDPALGDFHWQDGSNSPDYVIDMAGYYELTISNMCGEYVDDIEVIGLPLPTVDLGPDEIELCEGQEINYNFDPDLGEYVWQDGTNSETYTITNPGTYSVTMTNDCGSASDQVDVLLQSAPDFDLGDDITICPAQLPITLDVGNATNASFFQWQDGSTNSQYQVNTGGTYSVTVSNDCFAIADQIEVVVEDADPVVVLPPDQTLCPGQTFLIDASGIQGNYLWQDNSTSSTFTVSQEGTYSLSVTNQCGTGSDSVFVNYIDSLSQPDLGADVNLCPGEQYIFYAGVQGVSYTWQDGSTADSLLVSGAGTYALTIADACTTAVDSVSVTISNNPPQVDLPASLSLCQSDTLIIDPGISGVQFIWNDGSASSTLSVTNPGTYSLTISNSCGTDADTIQITDAGSTPVVDLGQDISLCSGDVSLIQPVSSGVNSWLWQDGSILPTYTASGPGIINVQASNNCGVSYDTLVVSSLPDVPVLQLGSDTALCPGETFTLNISTTGVNILWSDGSTSPDFNVSGPGLVYASITNSCGTSSDTIDVTALPAAPTLNLGNDQSLCPGETIMLSPGIPNVSYLWQDGSTNSSFAATLPGLVILTVSNACGSSTDTIEIIENTEGPQIQLGNDIVACEGDTVTLNAGISGVDYLWQDGSTLPYYTTSISGTYILQVSNACGIDIDTIVVDLNGEPPMPSLGPDTLVCEGVIFQLYANAGTGTSVAWQDGSNFPVYNVSSPGIYVLTESNQCGTLADTVLITYESAPGEFDLGADTILCPNEFILLHAPDTQDLLTWQDGSHDKTLVADHKQTYSLMISNQCGSAEDEINISFDERIPVINIEDEVSWCKDDIITLDATQAFEASYEWNTGSHSPSIQINSPGSYSISVSTDCQAIEKVVNVVPDEDCDLGIYIPSVFSPNGDQVNDFFEVQTGRDLDVVSMSCLIFDRWGNNVFNSHEINFAWDGKFKNSYLQPGVYAYVVRVEYRAQGEIRSSEFEGGLTLIR